MRNFAASFIVGMAIFLSIPQWSGAKWVKVGSPGGGWITSLVTSGTNVFASTGKGGVFLSSDNGKSWRAANSGLTDTKVWCLMSIEANLFAGASKGVFLSRDNGTSWTAVNLGLPAETSVLCLAAQGANLFAGGNHGIFMSRDNGASWTATNSGLAADVLIGCLAASGTNLFAGTREKGIFISSDGGAKWEAVSSELFKKNELLCLEVNGTNLFAGTVYGGVFLSTNKGASWTAVNSGMPETEIHCFAVSGLYLFAGTGGGQDAIFSGDGIKSIYHGGGVLLSADNGTRWKAINSGLPSYLGTRVEAWIECLAVSETHLFAGTADGKVWRLPLSDLLLGKR